MTGKLFVITGPRGVGKTTLAATYLPPAEIEKVYFHDSENSANHIVEMLGEQGMGFGRYVLLSDRFTASLPAEEDLLSRINAGQLPWVTRAQRDALVDYYEYVLRDLDENLEQGKYEVYVHDTLERLEAGMAAWVERNKKLAGVSSMAFGRFWTEGVYPLYEQLLNALYARGVKVVILTSHLKTPWEDNRPVVGKVAPSGKSLLYKLSSLMLWLVNDGRNEDGAPAGLVLKERLGLLRPTPEGEWKMHRMLPRRIPHCTWSSINAYLLGGCDLANPDPGEVMSKDEEEMISQLLTDKQMQLMILSAQAELEDKRAETAPVVKLSGESGPALERAQAEAMQAQGMTVPAIAKELGRPLPLVKSWLDG